MFKKARCESWIQSYLKRQCEQCKINTWPRGSEYENLIRFSYEHTHTHRHGGRERERVCRVGGTFQVDGRCQRSALHIVSSFWTPHRVSALFTSCFSSSGFSVMWMTSVRPLLPRTQGMLRKTSSFTPCKPWKARADGVEFLSAAHRKRRVPVTVSPGPAWTRGALCVGSLWCSPPGRPQTCRWPRKCSPSAWWPHRPCRAQTHTH